jgi:hypothetical protein
VIKPAICLFLMLSLVGCSNTRTVYVPGQCTDSTGPDSADGGSTPASGLTYCQAVLWIQPLLATIEQGNNNFAGIRDIEQLRSKIR